MLSGSSSSILAWCRGSISQAPNCSRICTRTFLARGVTFRVADVHGEVRSALRRIGFEREYGSLESGQTVHLVVSAWQASAAPAVATDRALA